MAGRSKQLEDDSRRFRTLLQSLDTARYHDDRLVDRETDISQARTEILSAILFGHEVVIPAGIIADCPAARVLLPEVLGPFESSRRRIAKVTGEKRRYFPFRLGVERRFVDGDPRGYDSFVRDYIEDQRTRISKHIELDAVSKDTQTNQIIVQLGQAYLNRDFDEIRKMNQPYGDYMEFIFRHFGEDAPCTPRPVNCRDGAFTQAPEDYFAKYVRNRCHDLERRKVDYDGIDMIRSKTQAMKTKMRNWGVYAGQRGSWYGVSEEYEERWTDVRNWFDHALYSRMASAFGIHIPSYFTQETGLDPISRQVALAHLDDRSLDRFQGDVVAGKPAIPPAAAKVNWAAIWQTVAEEDIQDRLRVLHLKLFDARDNFIARKREAISLPERDSDLLLQDAIREYRELTATAIAKHVEFLNSGQSGIFFKYHQGRLMVDALKPKGPNRRSRLAQAIDGTAEFILQAGAVQMGIDPNIAGDLLAYPLKSTQFLMGKSLGEISVETMVDFVQRPGKKARKATESFYAAEQARVNYWFTNG